MNSITKSIGNTYEYLSEAFTFQQQNQGEINQDESAWPSYKTIAVSFVAGVVGAYIIKKFVDTLYQPINDTPELFWKELENNQRDPLPSGPVVFMGNKIDENLFSAQKKMFFSCTAPSKIFVEYVENKKLKIENMIDLGCGIGANSIPLLKNNVNVIAIDSMQCLIDSYNSNVPTNKKSLVSLKCADLTVLEKYSTKANMADVVLAIDVLPYISISCWKSTMEKIVVSLKPGGYFFGTLFVNESCLHYPVIFMHEKFGAQYHPIQDLAARLVKHSGLEMVECRLRKSSYGCYEFVARKPSSS